VTPPKIHRPATTAEEALDEFLKMEREVALNMIKHGKEPPITGNDRVAGTVHAHAHALAYWHAVHAAAHMVASYLERFVIKEDEE
jgi:hypothetical protein